MGADWEEAVSDEQIPCECGPIEHCPYLASELTKARAIIEAADVMRDRIPCAKWKLSDCFAADRPGGSEVCHLCAAKRTYDLLRHPERAGEEVK